MKDDDSSVVEVSCWCGGMTWPKYIHLRCNQHQQQYSTIYPNEASIYLFTRNEITLGCCVRIFSRIWSIMNHFCIPF